MFNLLSRFTSTDSTTTDNYQAAEFTEGAEQPVGDAPGVLIGVQPHAENNGMADMAGVLQSVHDVTTDWRGRNTSPANAYELWFHEGNLTFWFHAADERTADAFRRRVASSYANSNLFVRNAGDGFPRIPAGHHVAGATVDLRRHHFYPIRHRNDEEGFESNPYGVVTSEMIGSSEAVNVLQVVFRPAKHGWADGDSRRSDSVDDVAESLREGTVTGWRNPRVRDASSKEKAAAKIVEQQRGELGFHANIRVLAASPDPTEAEARARGVGSIFQKYYNSSTEQGFAAHAVDPGDLTEHVETMHAREYRDRGMLLTVDELASAAHIPSEEIETPRIDWRTQQSGGRVPVENQGTEEGR